MIQMYLPRHTSPGNPISGSVSIQNQTVSFDRDSSNRELCSCGVFFFFLKGAQDMLQGTDTEASGWDIYPASDIFSIDAAKTDGQFERDSWLV